MSGSSSNQRISFRQAILIITLSTCFVSGTAALVLLYYQSVQEKKKFDSNYAMRIVIPRNSGDISLSSELFEELLELSIDHATNIYQFPLTERQRQLAAFPLFKNVRLMRQLPGSLMIYYSARKPLFSLRGALNAAVAEDGIVIPLGSYYHQDLWPTIALRIPSNSETSIEWGSQISFTDLQTAQKLMHIVQILHLETVVQLQEIDLSRQNADSFGKREIVLTFEMETPSKRQTLFLRLNPESYANQLENFAKLKHDFPSAVREFDANSVTLDMRLPQIAFLSK